MADTLGDDRYALSLYFLTDNFSSGSLAFLANLSGYFCGVCVWGTRLLYFRVLLGTLDCSAFHRFAAVGLAKVLLAGLSKLRVKKGCWQWKLA
ncbi:MAG: hypothetical protein ACRC62_00210 [Microcoleus sp.]